MKVIYNNKEVANTTLNYNELFNKPLLNSHELVGNTSLNDIGVYSKPQVDNLIASTRSIKVVSALPTPLVANTMYYVGPDANNLYHIYLVDSSLTLIDLGMSQDAVYLGGNGIDISSDNEISVVFDNETLMLNSEGELYVRSATENVEGVVSYDNVSIKKNNSGKIYVPTTKSGDRFGVYPFTNTAGNTEVGKAIGFYTNDSDTGWKGELRLDETNHQLVFGDYTTSPSTSKPIVAGETTASGNRFDVYPYTDGSGTTSVGKSLGFYTSDTDTGWKGVIQWDDVNRRLYLGDYTQSTPVVTIIPSGTATVGSNIQPVYVNDGIITAGVTPFSDAAAVSIPNGADLNTVTYTAPGKYYTTNNAVATSLINSPIKQAFTMEVTNMLAGNTGAVVVGNEGYRIRKIRALYGSEYIQYVISHGGGTIEWGPWAQVLTSGTGSLKHWHPTNNTDYISSATIDGYVDHAVCVISGWFRLSQDVPDGTVLFTLPSGYKIADNTYGFIYGGAGGFKIAKAMYNGTTITASGAITANSAESKVLSITFMLSQYPA